MDDEGEGRVWEGESGPWEQETGEQWGADATRPWTCRFSSSGSHFLHEMASRSSVTVERGRDMLEAWRLSRRCEEQYKRTGGRRGTAPCCTDTRPARRGHRPCGTDFAECRGIVRLFAITTAELKVNLSLDP